MRLVGWRIDMDGLCMHMHVWVHVYTYSEGALDSAVYAPAVEEHLVHCYFVCVFHSHCDHCEAVAYEHDFHSGCVGDMAAREIGCCEDCNGFVLFVEVLDGLDCYFFAGVGGW